MKSHKTGSVCRTITSS